MCYCSALRCSFSLFFFFKQKTAYEMRISDWSSDVCSSDLLAVGDVVRHAFHVAEGAVLLPDLASAARQGLVGVELLLGNRQHESVDIGHEGLLPLVGHTTDAADRKSTRLNSSH